MRAAEEKKRREKEQREKEKREAHAQTYLSASEQPRMTQVWTLAVKVQDHCDAMLHARYWKSTHVEQAEEDQWLYRDGEFVLMVV